MLECVTSRILTSITRSRGRIQTSGDLGAATRSSKGISHNPGALRVAVEDEVRARALLVEIGNLAQTVADSIANLRAVVAALRERNLNVVAGLALLPQLGARSIGEGECTVVVVRRIVAAGHEDNGIGAGSVELGGRVLVLSDGDGCDSAEREKVADGGRHY